MGNWLFECKSSMDKGTKRKSIFVFVGIALIIAILLFISRKSEENISILVALGLFALYFAALAYGILNTPYSYQLSKELLVINRRRSPLKIPLDDIQKARVFSNDDRKGLVKTFGAEGVIGNLGRFSTDMHEKLHVHTSRDTNWTLVRMKTGKKYIISPDDLELIQKINDRHIN
jgi:Bacterial PH domain